MVGFILAVHVSQFSFNLGDSMQTSFGEAARGIAHSSFLSLFPSINLPRYLSLFTTLWTPHTTARIDSRLVN